MINRDFSPTTRAHWLRSRVCSIQMTKLVCFLCSHSETVLFKNSLRIEWIIYLQHYRWCGTFGSHFNPFSLVWFTLTLNNNFNPNFTLINAITRLRSLVAVFEAVKFSTVSFENLQNLIRQQRYIEIEWIFRPYKSQHTMTLTHTTSAVNYKLFKQTRIFWVS